jgi:nicotinate dehydrogenase subunit A
LRRIGAVLSWYGFKQTAARRQSAAIREEHMAKTIQLNVNGKSVKIAADDPDMPLLYALRDNLGLHGPRFGCGLGQCGSCTVHVDGKAVRSCQIPLSSVTAKQKVVTLEGLAKGKKLHRVQQAFIDEQAAQCGYCINGMIMESAAFLAKNKNPSEADIKQALASNLCRCGTHARIVRAVKRAAASA